MEIKFAPRVLEQLEQDMTNTELQDFINELQQSVSDGTMFEKAVPLDLAELSLTDPEQYEAIMQQLSNLEDGDVDVQIH